MSSGYEVKSEITGIAQLRFNRFILEAGAGGSASKTDEALKADAEARCYKNSKGLFVPAEAVKKCLINGASMGKLKDGRSSMVPFIKATVFLTEKEIPLNKETYDGMEKLVVRIPPGIKGARVPKYFCYLNPGWQLNFTLYVADGRREAEKIKLALQEAGTLCGLLDGRPDNGRFEVTGWKVIKGK